ncbi:MAG TPA: DUF1697 domain-containing protein [Acidimicrobiia bacterium]|nr:DUF1697 domain-containing protein [Acidimicrobiia bacterium]
MGSTWGGERCQWADLRGLLSDLGLDEVATDLQSGNAVSASDRADRVALSDEIEKALADQVG